MKKVLLVITLCSAIFIIGWGELTSHGSGWQEIRSVTAIDDPALAAATMDCKPLYAKPIDGRAIRGLELFLAAAGSDGGIVRTKIWIGKGRGGPARLAADITWTLGAMLVTKDPQTQTVTTLTRYSDTAVAVSSWPTDIKISNSGSDMLCSVTLDGLDGDWIAAEVLTLTNVTKANVYFGYFE